MMLTAIFILHLLAGFGHEAERGFAKNEVPGFMGFRLGMKASVALRHEGKNPKALDRIKPHLGQRVISDTVPVTACKLPMRRSLGFDSASMLTAVGLTYKTTPEHITDARDCAHQWLVAAYGAPTGEAMRDSTKQEVWTLGPARITLEAKAYNARDYFVLMYYYYESSERGAELPKKSLKNQ
jgi:hypothetical protein